ncbi:MFS transporter [Facilibium subflavum]|uniref:MFS transporter n=1 Tax=Facilibium subflavum TaxID=2219058 RepID=UPI000E65E780|nr:MFS transporter [Facilibium subflavum]
MLKGQNQTKFILFFVALLDFMGFTIAATIFPELFVNKSAGFLPVAWTHAERLTSVGIALGLYPLGQFLSASIFGVLSDHFGRKPVLLVTIIGTILATFLTAFSITINAYILLFISRFILGLFAGNVSVAQASMVDVSDEKSRASNISLVQLSLGLAWVCGAPLGSFLSDHTVFHGFNYSTPFYFLTAILFIIGLFLYLGYRETLCISHRGSLQKIHLLKGLTLTIDALKDRKAYDILWVWLIFIGGWALFLQFLPTFLIIHFNYTAHTVGPMLAFMGGTFAGTQIFIARRFLRLVSPEKILRWVIVVPGLAALGIGVAHNWWFLHIVAFLFPFSMGFTLPALLGAISSRGAMNEQGALLGKAQSIQALMTIIVTMLGGKLLVVSQYMTTFVGGFAMLAAWLIYLSVFLAKKKHSIRTKLKRA